MSIRTFTRRASGTLAVLAGGAAVLPLVPLHLGRHPAARLVLPCLLAAYIMIAVAWVLCLATTLGRRP